MTMIIGNLSSGQMKLKLSYLATWTHVIFEGKLVKYSTPRIFSPQLNMVVVALSFGVALPLLVQENLFEFMAS